MKKNKIIAIVSIVLTAILTAVSLALLPEIVTTQFAMGGGDPTTMPKLYAVVPPALLGFGGALTTLFGDRKGEATSKGLLITGVGVLVFALMLFVNL